MGNLNRFFFNGQQAGVGQQFQDPFHFRHFAIMSGQFMEERPAAGVRRTIAKFGQPQKDPPGNLPPGAIETAKSLLSCFGNRAVHTARSRIAFQGHHTAVPVFPGFEQGMGKQGQSPFFATKIPQDQINQSRFKLPIALSSWLFNCPLQFIC